MPSIRKTDPQSARIDLKNLQYRIQNSADINDSIRSKLNAEVEEELKKIFLHENSDAFQ